MKVKICNCIDNNPIREFDVEQTNLTVLELLEHSLQRLNLQNLKDNVTVFSDGQEVPCDLWSVFKLSKTRCLKFVIKPQDFFSIAMIIIALAVAVYTMSMLKKLKTDDKKQESGSSIYDPNAQGNKAKLEDPIPEQFGLVKAFPDYISDKHYFYVNNVRYMSMLLCQGVGYYDWSLDQMYIGATPISSYVGSDIDVLVADPNTDISSHDAHRCWYNSTEVTMSGKEVPATESNSRKRGEIVSATLTLNGLTATSNSDLHLSSGDMIRLYNLQGQDRTINLTDIELMPSSVRCYASSIPSNLNLALGWKVALTVRNGGSSETYPLTLINYGTDTNKGNFIDVNFVNLTITENTSATLVLKSFVFNDGNLESTHVLDNGFYEVQAVNGTSYTLLAKDKNGITYRTTSGWSGFSANRTSSAEIELVETASTLSNAKSNIAGYYRACPIGATSRYYEVDFSFPSGLYHLSDEGDYENRTATILLEWKIAGSTDAPQSITKVYTKNSPDAFGETISIDVGNDNNTYEFRVTNLSEYTTDSQDVQTFLWNGLKCLISEDTHYPDVTVIAITVRGSESLAELSDNQISTLWTRRLANLNDVKTTTYQDVIVNGFDTFNYSAQEMYDLIMANSWYPAYWEIPKNFMWINKEGYYRRYIKMQNWRDNGENDQTMGWSPNGATFWFTNERLINSREATIIQYQQVIDNLPVARTMDKDSSYISDHRDYYQPNYSINGNLQFWFEANNYSERTNLGRTYNGFCLCLFDRYKSSDDVGYYDYRLYAPIYGGGNGLGTLISSYLIESAFFSSQGGDSAHSIRIEHTRAYIKVWINPHENREDGSQGGRLIFNVTADDYPQIAIHFGQYIGFMKGTTYGSGGYFWTWYIGKLSIQYPTQKTITVANQSATTGEDKEINRSLSAPIKYICENSKFGKIYDEQNLMQLDQMWNTAGLNFDYRFDKSTTVLEAIKQCMQVGYTEPIIDGNKIKGTYRSENAYIEQMFTANNMTGEPKITYNFITPTDNDEADITYMNPQNWKQDEVYVDIDKSTNEASVYNYQNSQNTEKVEVLAVTDVNKAIKLGARRLREVMYQRKQIDFDCEFDALNCNYGSLIAVALPQDLNAYSGYVIDYDSNTLICELSDTVPSDVSLIYIRRYDGTVQQINCTYIDNAHVQLLSELDFNLRSNVQLDLLHYAIGKIEKYWVTSIKPSDKKCSVTAINYDARVFVDDPFEPQPEPEPTGLNLNGAELYQYILDHTGHNLQGTWETTEQNQLKVTGTNVNGSYVVFSELGALNDFILEWEMTVLASAGTVRINSGISPILLTDPTGSSVEGWNNGTITNAKFVYFMCNFNGSGGVNMGTLNSISDNGSMSSVNSSTGSFTVGTKYTYKLVRADGYLRLYQDNNLISEYQETTYADTPFYLGWYMWWGGTYTQYQANFIIDSYKIELSE